MNIKTGFSRTSSIIVLPLLAMTLAGCGSMAGDSGEPAAPASPPAEPPAAPTNDVPPAKSSNATPAATVTSFVTQVLQEQYQQACTDNIEPPAGQQPEQACAKPETQAMLTRLHDAWAKPGVKLPPEGVVKVKGVTKQADKATVDSSKITLDDRNLRELALIGSSGDTGSYKLALELTKQGDRWLVSNVNIEA